MATVLSAMQLKKGAKVKDSRMGVLVQPLQMIPFAEKDESYLGWNMDWFEWQGIKQLMRSSPKLLKFYNAAKGIIDRSDYICEESNDLNEMMEVLTENTQNMLELRYYPLIPTIIDSFRTEFSKRQTKLMFQAVDPLSTSEMEQDKQDKLEQILLADAEFKLLEKLQEQGVDFNDPNVQKELSPDSLKQLPNLQQFYRTGYRNIYAEWAQHQKTVDDIRFEMDRLEEVAFVDKLVTDREFWHFKMKENDYEIELWNPLQTFYHKSPDRRWISQANWVGMIDLMTAPDVIDKYGWVMTDEQLRNIEAIYPIRAAGYLVPNLPNDGSYYDATRSHDWNTQMPSLQYRQFVSKYDVSFNNGDIVQEILLGSEDLQDFGNSNLLRVSTIYWKSQRKVGHLTKIDETGIPYMDIVDEGYTITDKPVYDTTIYREKTRYNLVFGEHIDWIWINDIWGGIKIGPNRPAWWGMNNPGGMQPMYIGITQNKPGRLPFQFKGDDNLYGVKLPVEGAVFTDRNTLSVPMIAKMMPSQIGYNMVNNQIADILVDELGTVILLDQNALPKHSLGEDWGPNSYQKAWVAMKNFQMLPLDTSLQNLSQNGNVNFQHYQTLDLSQTQRLLSRIQLSNYFEAQCYKIIGFNQQRMAQPIGQETSAKEYEESMRRSYDQTEMHFIEHCDYLMPRVHQMRTELAQYYQSKNPDITLQYVTSNNEKEVFKMDGTKLLMRDINVYPVVKVNARQILQNIKQLLLTNNTTGATIYDLGKLLQIDDLADLNDSLKMIEDRTNQEKQQEQQFQQQMQDQQLQQEEMLKEKEWSHEDIQNEKERQTRILIAEINAEGRAASTKDPEASEGAYQQAQKDLQSQQQWQEQMNFDKQKHYDAMKLEEQNQRIQQGKIEAENRRTNEKLISARKTNANKSKTK
jgi:hypothetical protein